MGIKFLCPNGHKLNVKSFLAGKRGVCPDCGATFRIPADDGADSGIRAAPIPSAGSPSQEQVAATMEIAVAAPVAAIAAAAIATPAAVAVPVGKPVLPVSIATPIADPSAPMPGGVSDPIAEAPAAIWYVRPPGGQQYGPARGDNLRKWIAEGRVSGDSLVWREGWTDWRSASQVFPSLRGAAAASAGSVAEIAAPRTTRTAGRYAAKKKSGSGLAITALVLLVVVCLVLVGVLVVVLMQQGK